MSKEDKITACIVTMYAVAAASMIVFVVHSTPSAAESAAEEARLTKEWHAAGCPIYTSECGSKHKYACERIAYAVGRVQVGDIFVQTHATCEATK